MSKLSPMLDDGVIQVKGRAEKAVGLPGWDPRPVILDPKHRLTQLLIQHYHEKSQHHGQERVLNELRQRDWILKARAAVCKSWITCQRCKIAQAKPAMAEMAPLPTCTLLNWLILTG